MAIRQLDRDEWRFFLDHASRIFQGKHTNIEVASLDFGTQTEAFGLPLVGIVFDPKSDIIEILVDGGLDHLIYRPRAVYVDLETRGMVSFEIIDGDGAQQIVILRDPLMLPPPAGRGRH